MIPQLASDWHRVNITLAVVRYKLKHAEARFIALLEVKEYDENEALRQQPRQELK